MSGGEQTPCPPRGFCRWLSRFGIFILISFTLDGTGSHSVEQWGREFPFARPPVLELANEISSFGSTFR